MLCILSPNLYYCSFDSCVLIPSGLRKSLVERVGRDKGFVLVLLGAFSWIIVVLGQYYGIFRLYFVATNSQKKNDSYQGYLQINKFNYILQLKTRKQYYLPTCLIHAFIFSQTHVHSSHMKHEKVCGQKININCTLTWFML